MRDLIALVALVVVLLAPVVLYYIPTKKIQYIVLGIVSAAFFTFCFLSI